MEELSSSNYNNNIRTNNNIPNLKISSTTFPTKELPNINYNNNSIMKKSNSSNINNNLTFKITEKDCLDINSIVRNSVEKINDLLNSKEFNNNNFSKSLKRSSKNCIIEMLEKEKDKDKDKDKEQILKSKTLKESGMKTNFTFNINNFINVPGEQSKNETINKKTERYEDEEQFGITNEQIFSQKNNINNNNNNKAKTNQKKGNYNNNRTKNNNYISYGTNKHNNGKLFRNCVKKRKLFGDEINDNYNNNINIVNYTKRQKNKKCQNLETKEDKDKSITVNTKHKKNNDVNDDNANKDKNLNTNSNTLNNSIKNKTKDSNFLKYSISEDINNSKLSSSQKRNIINLNNFSPNIININSLGDNRNIKNFILNNSKEIENNKFKNNSIKSDLKEIGNKKVFSPQTKNKNYNNYLKEKDNYNNIINNKKNTKHDNLKKFKNTLNSPINNNILRNSHNKGSFSKIFSNKNIKSNPFNSNTNINDSFSNIDDNEKIRRTTNNKPFLKKENSEYIKKCGYSCEHYRNNYNNKNSQNVHKVLNRIYSKEFPNKIKTNNIMKLLLFLNEYLINNNLLDDYYDINNRNKLDIYSKFLCNQINIDFPQEDDVNIDKMVNSAKKIQRMWRKKKIEQFIRKDSEENELKKMVINKYIRKAGFRIKRIIGLFNTLVEEFNHIGNEKEMEEMFYNIQQIIKRKLTPYEKNNLYKEYINSIIYQK